MAGSNGCGAQKSSLGIRERPFTCVSRFREVNGKRDFTNFLVTCVSRLRKVTEKEFFKFRFHASRGRERLMQRWTSIE